MTMKWMIRKILSICVTEFRRIALLLLLSIFTFYTSSVFSQSDYGSESELIKAADAFLDDEDYSKAMPLYSQLVSLYPKNTDYNMKYGLSLLYADRDKTKCLKYLKYAASNADAEPIAEFHYATGLHVNYEFTQAIKRYKKFKEKGNAKQVASLQTDRQIEMCNNGKKLLLNIFDLNVIEKKEIGRDDFFRTYNLGEIGGKIIVKPDEFKSKLDLKSNDLSLIYLPSEARLIYYAGYGTDKNKGKEIFRVRRTEEGNWSEPQNIGNTVNTSFDEDFPFMHPDGTLYFASKGHNSMGGYDLFKSEYNESTDTWSTPENLNFAISSAFDDLLFISDAKGQLAYFASNRNSLEGKINVYRVQITRKPFDLAFLKGKFIVEGNESVKSAKITIYDLEDDKKVGTYFTNENSGNYSVKLPKAGRTYKFVVETSEDSPVHTGKVEIPEQTDIVSLNQEIRLVGSGSSEKLVIKNLFDETSTPDVNDAEMLALLRSASNLDVNATEEEVLSQIESTPDVDEKGTSELGLSVQEEYNRLVEDMDSFVADLKKEIVELNNHIAFGFNYSFEKAKQADKLYEGIEELRGGMAGEANAGKKKGLQETIINERKNLEPVASDAIVSYDFTKSLANEYDEKKNDFDRMKKALTELKSSGAGNSIEDMQNSINEYGPHVQDMKSMKSVFEIAPQRYKDLLSSTNEKLNQEEAYYNDLKRDIESMKRDIGEMEKEIGETKSKKAKEQLTSEKGAKEIDLQDIQYEFKQVTKKYVALRTEKRNLEHDSEQLNAFVAKLKSNDQTLAQLNNEDQDELNKLIDYFKEQRLIEDVIGAEIEAFIAGTEEKQELNTAQKYGVFDNSGKRIDYDELYSVNLAGIELIFDRGEKDEEKSKLYKNWSETVSEEKKIKENELQFTENNGEKEILTEEIAILEQKEISYMSKSQEYHENALAFNQETSVEQEAATEQKTAVEKEDKQVSEVETTKPSTTKTEPSATTVSTPKNVGLALAAGSIIKVDRNVEKNQINDVYEKQINETRSSAAEGTKDFSVAAVELNWAKSLNESKTIKTQELSTTQNIQEKENLQREIAQLDKEIDTHKSAASDQFSAFEIEMFLGAVVIRPEIDDETSKGFNPNVESEDRYEVKYGEMLATTQLDVGLSEQDKQEKLTGIHNNWAKTIQDEILYLSGTITNEMSADSIRIVKNEMIALENRKKEHIDESNSYYNKVKTSAGIAIIDTPEKTISSDEREKEDVSLASNSYQDLKDDYQSDSETSQKEIEALSSRLNTAESKYELQHLELSLLLLNQQKEDEEKAVVDLQNKGSNEVMTAEAERAMADESINWQEEATDYVFEKKDFNADLPNHSEALKAYVEAKNLYEEVKSLEKQKTAYLEMEIIDKEADIKLREIQESLHKNMVEAYQALARSNELEFKDNKRKIDAYVQANPELKTESPKIYNQIQASNVVYQEVEKYRKNAVEYNSNTLKYDTYDQAQFMGEYAVEEQEKVLNQIGGTTFTGELAFLSDETKAGKGSVSKQIESFKITQEELDVTLEKPAFIEYEKDRKAILDIESEQTQISTQVAEKDGEIDQLLQQRDDFVTIAIGLKKRKRKKMMKEAEVIDVEIAAKRKERDSLAFASVQLSERDKVIKQNSQRLLNSVNEEERYQMLMLAEVRYQQKQESQYVSSVPSPPVLAATDQDTLQEFTDGKPIVVSEGIEVVDDNEFLSRATVIPTTLEGDLFLQSTTGTVTPYNEAKPIPLDEAKPTGLIFQVQIGAFRNPIPQDLFKGFAPLMGEKRGDGITRYTAGLFRDFGNANNAKNEIRKLGYYDAFVVAFMDGQRISFQELRGLGDVDLSTFASATPVLPAPEVPQEVLSNPSKIIDQGQVSNAIAEQTINTHSVQGIFFTVQVGVYTNTILPDKLKVIRELNSELLENGTIRYSAGQFDNIDQARVRQQLIRQQGVGDAFVTAYNNGNRITVSEAINFQQ